MDHFHRKSIGNHDHHLSVRPDLLNDLPDLRLKAHVQHPIGLIQHQVGHATEVHFAFYGGEGENDVDVEDPYLPPESQ